MRITDESCWDIIWVARDAHDHVALCRSMGGEIPGFVRSDAGITLLIAESLSLPKAIDRQRRLPFDLDKYTSLYGFYCFYADDPYQTIYRSVARPPKPRKFSELPERARLLMEENVLPFNIGHTVSFRLENGLFLDITEEK